MIALLFFLLLDAVCLVRAGFRLEGFAVSLSPLGFMAWDLGFGVWGLGFEKWGLGVGVHVRAEGLQSTCTRIVVPILIALVLNVVLCRVKF